MRVELNDGTKVVHLYLDENELKLEHKSELRLNGFTRESVYRDFPIRGHVVLFHIRRCRWLDSDGHNVMTEYHLSKSLHAASRS